MQIPTVQLLIRTKYRNQIHEKNISGSFISKLQTFIKTNVTTAETSTLS